MAVTLNASVSSGFIATSDTSGVLELQNNGTTRMTVNSSGVSFAAQPLIGGVAPPAFSAYATTGVSVANNTFTKITFDVENFDTNNNYASSRFTPTVAGYYQMTACVLTTNSTTGCSGLAFYKNGTAFAYGSQVQNTNGTTNVGGSALIYCNGSTDYIEVFVVQTTGGTITTTASGSQPHWNVFSGVLVRGA